MKSVHYIIGKGHNKKREQKYPEFLLAVKLAKTFYSTEKCPQSMLVSSK